MKTIDFPAVKTIYHRLFLQNRFRNSQSVKDSNNLVSYTNNYFLRATSPPFINMCSYASFIVQSSYFTIGALKVKSSQKDDLILF
jgi:hypothetical protein